MKMRKKASQKSSLPQHMKSQSTTYKDYYTHEIAERNTEKETHRQHVHRHMSHKPREEEKDTYMK